MALDLAGLLAGTQYRGAFEERIHGVVKEVAASKGQTLLFIDELHLIGWFAGWGCRRCCFLQCLQLSFVGLDT